VRFILFSLLFALYSAVDPATPSVAKATYTFVLNETRTVFSTQNSTDPSLMTPFPFTSFNEKTVIQITYPNLPSHVGAIYTVQESTGNLMIGVVQNTTSTNRTVSYTTLGPCDTNGLGTLNKKFWSILDFSNNNLKNISINGTIYRVYQNASLPLGVPQWILFGPGMRSYYVIQVPLYALNMYLQIDLRRHNTTVKPPPQFFSLLRIATIQSCLNPSYPSFDGTIEPSSIYSKYINGTSDAEATSDILEFYLPRGEIVYLTLDPQESCCTDLSIYDKMYSITASIYTFTSPISPTGDSSPDHALDVFGIVCGVLIIVGAVGVAVSIYYKKRKGSYKLIQS